MKQCNCENKMMKRSEDKSKNTLMQPEAEIRLVAFAPKYKRSVRTTIAAQEKKEHNS